jgi:hypothetical protein
VTAVLAPGPRSDSDRCRARALTVGQGLGRRWALLWPWPRARALRGPEDSDTDDVGPGPGEGRRPRRAASLSLAAGLLRVTRAFSSTFSVMVTVRARQPGRASGPLPCLSHWQPRWPEARAQAYGSKLKRPWARPNGPGLPSQTGMLSSPGSET